MHRRRDGSVSFDRTWVEYEDGFGSLTGNFWHGLRALHCLTGQGGWEMRVDVQLKDGINFFLQYKEFKVASAQNKYNLTVSGFQGNTDDNMVGHHNGMFFTTKDRDNDPNPSYNCALIYGASRPTGGWWFNNACWININPSNFCTEHNAFHQNRKWYSFSSLNFMEIKIRPHNCKV